MHSCAILLPTSFAISYLLHRISKASRDTSFTARPIPFYFAFAKNWELTYNPLPNFKWDGNCHMARACRKVHGKKI